MSLIVITFLDRLYILPFLPFRYLSKIQGGGQMSGLAHVDGNHDTASFLPPVAVSRLPNQCQTVVTKITTNGNFISVRMVSRLRETV